MAGFKWFPLLVLIYVTNVFADVCNFQQDKYVSCDDCRRCGKSWCNSINVDPHCSGGSDDWCPGQIEYLTKIATNTTAGTSLSPIAEEKTMFPNQRGLLEFTFIKKSMDSKKPKPMLSYVSTTQNHEIKWTNRTTCNGRKCIFTYDVMVKRDFCTENSTSYEFVQFKLNIEGSDEQADVRIHVPCACSCSEVVERNSTVCNGHGDLSCGACKCIGNWTGQFCEDPICEQRRGDVSCTNPAKPDKDCSGNGVCGKCDRCKCFSDREGSQYFDPNMFCADVCMAASECDACLRNSSLGLCSSCDHPLTIHEYNHTMASERDQLDRRIWVRCNETDDECYIEYVAMKDDLGEIHVMMVKHCNEMGIAAGYTSNVSIIGSVLGVLGCVAGVGGFLLWKHLAGAAGPSNESLYQNIGAENCVGQNPLYESPISSFKNPTYGKQ